MKSTRAFKQFSFFFFIILYTIASNIISSHGEMESPSVNWTACQSFQLANYFKTIAHNYSNITRLISIGKSIEGRDLWVLIISDSPLHRPLMRPQIKFVGNINGFSGPSCYVLLKLIDFFLQGYERENSLERRLIQTNEIHILPNMNPDGFSRSAPGVCDGGQGRYNALGKELNRDFPDIFNPMDANIERQPETKAIMEWIANNNFVISMSYMTGAMVVTYPFDSIPFSEDIPAIPRPNLTPDHDIFKYLASTYVQNINTKDVSKQSTLSPWHCPSLERNFPDGIVNGAEWMPASGTMLDHNYLEGTFELLVGISCCRNENNEKALEKIWFTQKLAMVKMIQETDYGVRGQVVDSDTWAALPWAQMRKLYQNSKLNEGIHPMPWRVSSRGEFWRLLLPGKYILEVYMSGYKEMTIPFEVKPTEFTYLFIQLEKEEDPITTTTSIPIYNELNNNNNINNNYNNNINNNYNNNNNITRLKNLIIEDENNDLGKEMRDQSQSSSESFNNNNETIQIGMTTILHGKYQNISNTSEILSKSKTKSWIFKLLRNKSNHIHVLTTIDINMYIIIITIISIGIY